MKEERGRHTQTHQHTHAKGSFLSPLTSFCDTVLFTWPKLASRLVSAAQPSCFSVLSAGTVGSATMLCPFEFFSNVLEVMSE